MIISLILSNDKTYEICERYHDSAVIDALRSFRLHNQGAEKLGWDPVDEEELRKAEEYAALAVQNWGPEIRARYGWAAPLLPNIDPWRIRFSDLERAVEGEFLRPGYVHMNESIHAGPRSVINQVNFRTPHLMITRPTSNDDQFSDAFLWALRLLGMITDVSSKSIMFLAEDYDQYLIMGELSRRENKAIELL